MTAKLKRRVQKTPWLTDAIRAEMLQRYADVLESPVEAALKGFVRWVVQEARYLAAEGNFQMFAHVYLAVEMDETTCLWDFAGEGPD